MKFKGIIKYTDHRTGESWLDSEWCQASNAEVAAKIFNHRIRFSNSAELIELDSNFIASV